MSNPSSPLPPGVPSSSRKAPGFLRSVWEGIKLGRDLRKGVQTYRDQPGFMLRRMDEFADVFMGQTGWMTGNLPLQPKTEEGTPPRRFQYQPGYNISIQPRSSEQVTFQQLRGLGEYTLVRVVIERIKEALKAHEWDIVPDDTGAHGAYQQDITLVKEFLEKPDHRHSWDEWLGMLLEDVLVIDAMTLYPRRTRNGKLWGLEVRDGATIKVLADERGDEPLPPAPAYQQFLYGVPYANFTTDELIYRPRNRRSNHFYGFSPVEQIIIVVNQGIRRELYNLAQFTDGNIPSAFATLPPDWKPEEIKQWSDYWDAVLAGDPQNRSKIRWMPGGQGVGITKMRDEEVFGLFNKFDEWLSRVVCYAFGLSPMAFVQMTNRAVAQEMGDVEAEYGFASMKMYVERLINDIIDHYLLLPHLRFNWVTDRGRLQEKRVKANVEYAKAGIKQIDEIREEEGLAPLGLPPGIITATGFVPFGIPTKPQQVGVPTGAEAGNVAEPMEEPSVGTRQPLTSAPGVDTRSQQSTVERRATDPLLVGPARTPPGPPYAPMGKALMKCRLEELGKWERFAITRVEKGVPVPDFTVEFIDPVEAGDIRDALAKSATSDHIKHIFASRRKRVPELRLAPPRAGDAAYLKNDLKVALRSVLEAEALRIAQTKEE